MAFTRATWLLALVGFCAVGLSPASYLAREADMAMPKRLAVEKQASSGRLAVEKRASLLRGKVFQGKPEATKEKKGPPAKLAWHQDIQLLSRVMFLMLPCMMIAVGVFEWMHRSWADVDFDAPCPMADPAESRMELSRLFEGVGTLTAPYFSSPAGFKGRVYILVVLLLGVCALFLALVHNAWQKEFWDTFEQKNSARFFQLLAIFIVLVATFVLNDVYSQYIRQMLYISWRDFMTRRFVRQWLGANAFYTMQLDADRRRRVENPDQRIQEDIHLFINATLILGYELLNSIGHLIIFLPLLFMLSPSKAFGVYHCPGWLLVLAFVYSALGTLATHTIGKRLIPVGFARQQYEADFRFGLVRVRDYSESIVLYRGERSEESNLHERFERIKSNWWQYMLYSKRLAYFTRSFSMVQMIMPFFILAPSYFSGDISMGTLFQLTQALGTVCTAFDCIVNHFSTVTEWRATSDRLLGFEKAMSDARERLSECKAVRHTGPPDKAFEGRDPESLGLAVQGLTVRLPDGQLLWKDLSFAIPRGQRVLFTGREGIGKSVLFRALAGAWPYVESGQLWMLPDGLGQGEEGMEDKELPTTTHSAGSRKVLFVPQRSYFPAFCTLRGALAYPEAPGAYEDTACLAALRDVKLESILDGDLAPIEETDSKTEGKLAESGPLVNGSGLDLEAKWSMVLSPGQQQRLAFARVLLLQPNLLFLDEATSSVGQDSAKELYGLIFDRLPADTTIVSISHEVDLLSPLHDRTLCVDTDDTDNAVCKGLEAVGDCKRAVEAV